MGGLTSYQLVLIVILVLWPLAITALLFVMSRIENYVNRSDAESPQEAGLEPVSGRSGDKEVRIVFGDEVIGESK
jgi:NADH:ubiquinone oxidoreductase subunit 3 (subunit A)